MSVGEPVVANTREKGNDMGLDMYLGARRADGIEQIGYWRKANAIHGWFVRECADGVDECQEITVTREQLAQLRTDCNNELANRDNAVPTDESARVHVQPPNSGQELMDFIMENMKEQEKLIGTTMTSDDPLAPTAGFFFGSTEKDEWYYQELLNTIDVLDSALGLPNATEFVYQASW
jgi:hypothetical protein